MKKVKQIKDNIIIENYYVHIFEPDQKIQNYKFINLSEFTKKKHKKQKCSVYIGDLLEYFDRNECLNILNQIVDKLGAGSKLYVQGVDSKSIAQSFASDELTEIMYNVMMYGLGKKNIFTFPTIKHLIKTIQTLEIHDIKFMNSINYYIECNKL